jgi:hypothetical protein
MAYKSERDNKPKKEHLEKLKLYLKKIDELRIDKRKDRDSV